MKPYFLGGAVLPTGGEGLINEPLNLRTARRGDYRVLFTLDAEHHILYVHRIEHRSDVHKQR